MIYWRQAVGILLAACLPMLGGCVSRGPLIDSPSKLVELDDTPFFPQTVNQCGPAALATLLGASQISVTPAELAPQVYLPGRRGSLQIEMQAAPRQFGRISYQIKPELAAILKELDAGRPVLVLHNYGLPFWPRWHYAVVVGYDGSRNRILLRSGKVRRQQLSAANFMRAWDNADRWGLVLLRPGELPESADKDRYLQAAAAFERVATPADTLLAFEAGTRFWPEEPVPWIGVGTANYLKGDLQRAAGNYRKALQLDSSQTAARNNLAMTLLDLGCPHAARSEMERIVTTNLSEGLAENIADTRRQIEAKSDLPDQPSCAAQ
ncbi:MAG: PA2778 family cysteine peptidase [Steroidobacteraceae bacterium]